MVQVKTSDNVVIELASDVATQCGLLKNLIEDIGEEHLDVIPINNLSSVTMGRIVELLPLQEEERMEKLKVLDRDTLFEVILAANYLSNDKILKNGCKTAAERIKGKPVEEIKEFFGIETN